MDTQVPVDIFAKSFIRYSTGTWECVRAAALDLPEGRIEVVPGTVFPPGTKFMNVDLVAMLEARYRKHRRYITHPGE